MAPKRAPATPAIAADRLNTTSLVVVRLSPRVAHAASLSFMADSTRPNGPRRMAERAAARRAKTTARKTTYERLVVIWIPKNVGRGILTEPLKPKAVGEGKNMSSMAAANARVARARYSPRSLSAGSAMSPPTTPANTAAASSPQGDPPCPNLDIANAPNPAKVIWQRDTWPPQPARGTSDSMTSPRASPMRRWITLATDSNPVRPHTATTRPILPTRDFRADAGPATFRRIIWRAPRTLPWSGVEPQIPEVGMYPWA